MNKRTLAGVSALSLALPGLVATMALMPAASAIESDDDTTSSADRLSSSATMEEQCKWVLIGAPSGITLTPTTEGAEYNGDALELSSSLNSISVHSTGNLDESTSYASYTECAFFQSPFKPTATLAIDGTAFTAQVSGSPDAGMNFSLSGGNPLAFSFTADDTSGTCDAWATAATSLNLSSTSPATLLDLAIGSVTSPVTSAGNNDKCQLTGGSLTVDIPASLNPASPGAAYTFQGPNLTTALATATS